MNTENYEKQVALLLDVLPLLTKENCFALKGGTAINLFIRDMPRLSIDIDLTYLPIEPRDITLINLAAALERVAVNIRQILPNTTVIKHYWSLLSFPHIEHLPALQWKLMYIKKMDTKKRLDAEIKLRSILEI